MTPRAGGVARTGPPEAAELLPSLAIPSRLTREISASREAQRGAHPDSYVDDWIVRRRKGKTLGVRIIPLEGLRGWRQTGAGDLVHESGRFFSILGLHVRHREGRRELSWDQPVIEQPEIGILGILAARIRGVLHFCLQAKEEPGNIGGVQLSPTVQATYSNYTCAHGGEEPPFLSLFASPAPDSLIFSRLQTEDGSRFLYKSNRNMIVLAGDDPPLELPEPFIWLTLRQIAALLRRDNLVNACARSVLSALVSSHAAAPGTADTPSGAAGVGALPPIASTLQWLDDWRSHHHLTARRIGLNELQEWRMDEKGYFSHHEERFFRIVGLDIEAESREVCHWGQPILENASRGIIGLLLRERAGAREILMQARAEPGNRPGVQIAPTVQFTPGNYHGSRKLRKPFLFEEFADAPRFPMLSETLQAEEGARFFRECHAHRVLALPEGEELDLPPDYRWVPESHLRFLLHFGEQVNSCARSVLACLL